MGIDGPDISRFGLAGVTRPQDNIDSLRGLNKFAKDHHLPGIPEDEIEGIINRDALDILGVD